MILRLINDRCLREGQKDFRNTGILCAFFCANERSSQRRLSCSSTAPVLLGRMNGDAYKLACQEGQRTVARLEARTPRSCRWKSGLRPTRARLLRASPASELSQAPRFGTVLSDCYSKRTLSTDEPSSKSEQAGGKGSADTTSVAGVTATVEATPEEPRHSHIEMPSITDEDRVGQVTSWFFEVGDAVQAGDVVCEIELEHFSVGVMSDTKGFLAEILVTEACDKVPVGRALATIVHNEEDVAFYQTTPDTDECGLTDSGTAEDATEDVESFSWKDVLKAVTRLHQDGHLSEENASTLMFLARHKDTELLQAFEGCFDGDEYQGEIDNDLFLVQARDIAKRTRRAEEEEQN